MPFDTPLDFAQKWHLEGRSLALATVIETWGSAPRETGSMLVIDSEGNFEGSVSGGCVEGAVVSEAVEIIVSNSGAKVLEFGVADETAWEVGLSCGGKIRIHVVPVGKESINASILVALNEARQARKPIALIANLQTGEVSLSDTQTTHALDKEISACIKSGRSGCITHEAQEFFIHLHLPSSRLVMVGAVHIAQTLYPMAQACGFEVLIVDPRTAFATKERFSGARLLARWPQDVWSEMALDSFTAFAALSHDPKIDDEALIKALNVGCFYVGALGSRKTHAKRLLRLQEAGLSSNLCDLIASPIGVDIAASGPSEIAVSILAQIISRQRGGQVS